MRRKPYPSDVSDDEWAFVTPYLTVLPDDAPLRAYPLREVVNGLRWRARSGAPWPLLPQDLPPWTAVYAHTHHWVQAGVFAAMVHDLRLLLRALAVRAPQPAAARLDRHTLPSRPDSGARPGGDGATRQRGSTVQRAVDTLGQRLALVVTPATAQDRAHVAALAAQVQAVTGEPVALAFVDPDDTSDAAAAVAAEPGLRLEVVTLPTSTRGFVLLPRRWVVERAFPWTRQFGRLARAYERVPDLLAGVPLLAVASGVLTRLVTLLVDRT